MRVLCDFAMFCLNFHTFFYHIWTNILTQCTQLPVPVFCYFCISGLPAIKSAPKIPENLYKKSALMKLPESPKWDQRASTRGPGALVARPGGGAPGSILDPWWAP